MEQTAEQIKNFLQYVAIQFVKHPSEAELRVSKIEENGVRFRLILNKEDVATLIGRNGFTASAIRNILKAAAMRDNVNATLQIVSHEEEQQRLASLEADEETES